jgi:hypothetical protein
MPAPTHRVSPPAGSITIPVAKVGRYSTGTLARATLAVVVLCGAGVVTGCTIPSDCGDLDYPTYGGAWQRTRRDGGRVGSVFDPAGARSATLVDRDQHDETENVRSPREGILSTPPALDRNGNAADDSSALPSPSERIDAERLRSLDLDEISIERGSPAPPDLF